MVKQDSKIVKEKQLDKEKKNEKLKKIKNIKTNEQLISPSKDEIKVRETDIKRIDEKKVKKVYPKPLYKFKENDPHLIRLYAVNDMKFTDTPDTIIKHKLPLGDCAITLYRSIPIELVLTPVEFKELADQVQERIPINIFGKDVFSSHYGKTFNVPYKFSRSEHPAVPITHNKLKQLLLFSRQLTGYHLNQCIVNNYIDGTQHIGLHSDSETELVKGSPIICWTFYANPIDSEYREFHVVPKPCYGGPTVQGFQMTSGHAQCVIMSDLTQRFFKHGIPPSSTAKSSRLSITFRASTRQGFI